MVQHLGTSSYMPPPKTFFDVIVELNTGQKAILASGYSETSRVKKAQRLGVGQYVKKPYTLEKIGIAVKAQLGCN